MRRRISINSTGFREDREISAVKPRGVYRIFIMGDSGVYGWGVEAENTFSRQLEKRLNSSATDGRRFEVINAGVPGYTSYHGILLLERKLLGFDPDMIVIGYGWADHMVGSMEDKAWLRERSPLWTAFENHIAVRFRICQWFTEALAARSRRRITHRVSLDDYRSNLERMAAIARESGVKTVFLTVQSKLVMGEACEYTLKGHTVDDSKEAAMARHVQMNAIMRQVAADLHLPLVDAAEAIRRLTVEEGKVLFYRSDEGVDDVHPNEAGHAVIAELLYEALVDEGLVPES
jgi:lysophospholipase L1-like esterase